MFVFILLFVFYSVPKDHAVHDRAVTRLHASGPFLCANGEASVSWIEFTATALIDD